jgi:hypothetical protein
LSLGVFQSCLQDIKLPEKAEEKLQNEEEENLEEQASTNEQKLPSTISTTYRKTLIKPDAFGCMSSIYYNLENSSSGSKLLIFSEQIILGPGTCQTFIKIQGNGSILGTCVDDSYCHSKVLNKGALIGETTPQVIWKNNDMVFEISNYYPIGTYYTFNGFKFVDLAGNLHYGYIKYKITTLLIFSKFEILQVSVQNTPNAPIKAGQI